MCEVHAEKALWYKDQGIDERTCLQYLVYGAALADNRDGERLVEVVVALREQAASSRLRCDVL